jgi:antitoxin component of MazEF toxin-antitoxin module
MCNRYLLKLFVKYYLIGGLMSFVSRAISVGGSIMITIPRSVVEMLNLHPNEQLELEVRKAKKSGFGMFKGTRLTKFTKEDELKSDVE